MSFLDHKELLIIKGIGKVPGDTNSAEANPVVINLMDANTGIALDSEGGWSPNIPTVKSTWAESPITDGRTLLAGSLDNVKETIRVIITGPTPTALASNLSRLYDMRQDALDFWDTFAQIEPVYLHWYAACGTGPQYALIYTMDIAPEYEDSPTPTIRATLTIEREYGWRGIPPGANPKQWTLGNSFASSNAALSASVNNIVTQTVQNRREWNSTQTAIISQNFVDIAASQVPGDLPALCSIGLTSVAGTVYVARSTKTPRLTGGQETALILNAGDGNVANNTTLVADTGAPLCSGSATRARAILTGGGSGNLPRVFWNATTNTKFGFTTHRGRYAAFVRARCSAAASSITLQLALDGTLVGTSAILTAQGAGGTGNTTQWPISYLGVFSAPMDVRRSASKINGLGLDGASSSTAHTLYLYANLTLGTADLYVSDLILIPIDEVALNVTLPTASTYAALLDNTGYSDHGKSDDIAIAYSNSSFAAESDPPPVQGSLITLLPGIANRLHFLGINGSNAFLTDAYTVLLNIVPRWTGIRDV